VERLAGRGDEQAPTTALDPTQRLRLAGLRDQELRAFLDFVRGLPLEQIADNLNAASINTGPRLRVTPDDITRFYLDAVVRKLNPAEGEHRPRYDRAARAGRAVPRPTCVGRSSLGGGTGRGRALGLRPATSWVTPRPACTRRTGRVGGSAPTGSRTHRAAEGHAARPGVPELDPGRDHLDLAAGRFDHRPARRPGAAGPRDQGAAQGAGSGRHATPLRTRNRHWLTSWPRTRTGPR